MGGPNQRADFHLEEGEELFYMRKGAMTLPILTEGAIRTVNIKEGDVFLLPGRSTYKTFTLVKFDFDLILKDLYFTGSRTLRIEERTLLAWWLRETGCRRRRMD